MFVAEHSQEKLSRVNRKTDKRIKERMIHIRLDDKVHKRLKLKAVRQDTTVQNLVETLIMRSFKKSRAEDVR